MSKQYFGLDSKDPSFSHPSKVAELKSDLLDAHDGRAWRVHVCLEQVAGSVPMTQLWDEGKLVGMFVYDSRYNPDRDRDYDWTDWFPDWEERRKRTP